MKKIILSVAAILAFGYANAQIKTNAGTFTKPTAGTIIMEANMTPDVTGGGIFALPDLNSDLGMVGIKARKFTADNKALRLGANLSVMSSGEEDVDTEFSFGVAAGIEHHFSGAERLSTYWGYEGNIGFVSSNGDAADADFEGIDEEDGDFEDFEGSGKVTKFGFGANLFTGFDYYIMPKIYLGAEIAYGVAITNTTPDGGDGVTKLELAPSITPSFRLGWQF
jgi:hypothetical protein